MRAVAGDVSLPRCGVSALPAAPTHTIHCAAAVSFNQPLAAACAANITGALRVRALTRRHAAGARPVFLHVSTAFVHGGRAGSAADPLPAQLFPLVRTPEHAAPACPPSFQESLSPSPTIPFPPSPSLSQSFIIPPFSIVFFLLFRL